MTKRKLAERRRSGVESLRIPRRFLAALVLIFLIVGLYISRHRGARTTAGHMPPTDTAVKINTPLAKEYIYAGGRLVAIEEAGGGSRSPYPGTVPHAVPGTIEAEDFDEGGEGITYHDVDPSVNLMGAYRPSPSGVDIEPCGAVGSGCGFNVGNTWQGEWTEYTIRVTSSGVYDLDVQVASGNGGGGTFHVTVDGTDVTGALRVPDTGGWQSYQLVKRAGVTLGSGPHVLRLFLDTEGSNRGVANFDFIRFTAPGDGTAPSNLLATFQPAAAHVSLTWAAPASAIDHYEVERAEKPAGPFQTLSSSQKTANFIDPVPSGLIKAYFYRVRAVWVGGGQSSYGNVDMAMTASFADDPLNQDGVRTPISALHFKQLREAVNAVRVAADLLPFDWSGAAPRSLGPQSRGLIYASHFNDLRSGLGEALAKLGLPAPKSPLVSEGDPVAYKPVQELRDLMR